MQSRFPRGCALVTLQVLDHFLIHSMTTIMSNCSSSLRIRSLMLPLLPITSRTAWMRQTTDGHPQHLNSTTTVCQRRGSSNYSKRASVIGICSFETGWRIHCSFCGTKHYSSKCCPQTVQGAVWESKMQCKHRPQHQLHKQQRRKRMINRLALSTESQHHPTLHLP